MLQTVGRFVLVQPMILRTRNTISLYVNAPNAVRAKQLGKLHFNKKVEKQHTDGVRRVDDCIAIDAYMDVMCCWLKLSLHRMNGKIRI